MKRHYHDHDHDHDHDLIKVSDSNNGFVSTVFGPSTWLVLHMVSLNYPTQPSPDERDAYTQWFMLFGKVLPCSACRENFKNNLLAINFDKNVDMVNRQSFANCVWRLHNEVNTMLGKNMNVSFSEFLSFYEKLRADKCIKKTPYSEGSCEANTRSKPRCIISVIPEEHALDIPSLTVNDMCSRKV
jgi:hypothetical protein